MKEDLTGSRVHNWEVLSFDSYGNNGSENWLCRCCCGQEKIITKRYLNRYRSCGCKISNPYIPNIGEKFGMLTIESINEKLSTKDGKRVYNCLCDCGNKTILERYVLVNGVTKSCGCLFIKSKSKINGLSKIPEYRIWSSMKSRCYNKNSKAYKYYGGRGISVHKEWISDFAAFYKYVGPRPYPEYSLDRIDSDGNYEPGNVRWASSDQQWENRKKRGITFSTLQEKVRLMKIDTEGYSGLSDEEFLSLASDFILKIFKEVDERNVSLENTIMKLIKE
jgi:hypothetical protein